MTRGGVCDITRGGASGGTCGGWCGGTDAGSCGEMRNVVKGVRDRVLDDVVGLVVHRVMCGGTYDGHCDGPFGCTF